MDEINQYWTGLKGVSYSVSQVKTQLHEKWLKADNFNWSGRLGTVDLLIKIACFVKKYILFVTSKATDLN